MNTSGDAAEQIVRISLQGFEVTARVAGSGAKDIAALMVAIMKDKTKTKGKTNLTNMLKSGKELRVFSVKQEELQKFSREAERYGILYCAINKKKTKDGVVDILVKTDDAPKLNRIVQRFKLSRYNEVSIRSEIANTRNQQSSKSRTVKTKSIHEKQKEEIHKAPIKKEKNSLNPRLAKTVKNPLSKPSSKMQWSSDQGTSIYNRPSVRKKIQVAKAESKKMENARNKSVKVVRTPSANNQSRQGKTR